MSLRRFASRIFAQPRSWLRAIVRRNRLESEMDAELASHLELLTADLIRAGLAPPEAARRARIALGPALAHKEDMRASLGLRWGDELTPDLRYAARLLRKSPGFTLIAATSLALAIGANTTIFSVAKSLLYDRLDVPHAAELRLLRWTGDTHLAVHNMWGEFDSAPGGGMMGSVFSYPVFLELRAHNRGLQDLFAFKEDSMNATVRGTAQRVNVDLVSGNFFSALEVRPQLGRAIEPTDDSTPGAGAVAVISDGLWQRAFDRSPAALGQTIRINQSLFTVVGVTPRGFTGAKSVQASPDIFVPLSMQPVVDPKGRAGSLLNDKQMWWLNVMGRVRPDVPEAQALAALRVDLAAATRATVPMKAGDTLPRLDLAEGARGLQYAVHIFQKPVSVLMALTGFVLLLACANIANLLLARGAHRQREMSVRMALGAGRARVIRQLLTESLLLAALGGAGGLALGFLGRSIFPRLLSNAWERNELTVPMDWGVFAFAAAITLVTALLFGLAPAWLAARAEVSSSLKESAQTATRRRSGFGGKSIVAFQIALSTLLVVGAGLFLRTVLALNSVDVGFRTDRLLLFEVSPPAQRYGPGKDVRLHQRLEQAFAALPGVEGVAPSWTAYIADNLSNDGFNIEGESAGQDRNPPEDVNVVGSTFFHTMGIPIVAGRGFDASDTATSEPVAVVNQALVRNRFPQGDAIGKRFQTGDEPHRWIRIVGICADTRYTDLRTSPPAQFFMPYVQQPEVGGMTYAIRTSLGPAQLAPALRRVVEQADPDLPLVDLRTQRQQIDANMQMERLFAALSAGFGLLALALACVGIYGIMAYAVANRRSEIGIRLALGAQPAQVRGMILRESALLAAVGVTAGLAAALALSRLVRAMLYGVEPWDPVTLTGGVLLLLAVALAASWIPARRAAAVQPMEALRHE